MHPVAILETGGKQYVVRPGDVVTVERLTATVGSTLSLPDRLGQRTIFATVLDHNRAATVRVVKFHNKTRSYRRRGHRQSVSRLHIDAVRERRNP